MRVGVSSVNITPPVGFPMAGYSARKDFSKGIHDDLYAKALVFDDGSRRAALIRCDLIGLQRDTVEETRSLIEAEAGIEGGNVMIACTHTHSGPVTSVYPELEPWLRVLTGKMRGAVAMACRNLKEAKIGVGRGSVEGIVINRRNPGGPVDLEVGVIRIDDVSGNPLAALVNYTCHAVVLGYDNLLISADYPGYVMSSMEESLDVPVLFVNGACGDINPFDKLTKMRQDRGENIYDRGGGTFEEAERLGKMIGAEALKVFLGTETRPDLEVKATSETVKIPLEGLPSLEEAKSALKESKKLLAELLSEGRDAMQIYRTAMMVRIAENSLRCVEGGENAKSVEVQAFNVGGIGLVGLPGEVFVEIGLDIKKRSGFGHTFICELANDAIGYIPTSEAFNEPGYEVGVAKRLNYTEEIGDIIGDSALSTLAMTR